MHFYKHIHCIHKITEKEYVIYKYHTIDDNGGFFFFFFSLKRTFFKQDLSNL